MEVKMRFSLHLLLLALVSSLLSFVGTPAQAAYDPTTGNGTVSCGTSGTITIASNVVTAVSVFAFTKWSLMMSRGKPWWANAWLLTCGSGG